MKDAKYLMERTHTSTLLEALGCAHITGRAEGAQLQNSDLSNAVFRSRNFSGIDFSGTNFSHTHFENCQLSYSQFVGCNFYNARFVRCNITKANFTGADFTNATYDNVAFPTKTEMINSLDRVRGIVLNDGGKLDMDCWHWSDGWERRTCEEEQKCETTHCIAGWLQVCSTDPKIRRMEPETAGFLVAPIATHKFFVESDEALEWFSNREYAQ